MQYRRATESFDVSTVERGFRRRVDGRLAVQACRAIGRLLQPVPTGAVPLFPVWLWRLSRSLDRLKRDCNALTMQRR